MALGTILAGIGAASGVARAVQSFTEDDGGGDGPNRGTRLRKMFEDRLDRIQATDPGESAGFTAGVGALRDRMDTEAERDTEAAAARGLTGSQFELAQDEQRAEVLGEETRALLGRAQQRQDQRERSTLGLLMEASGFEEDIRARRQQRQDRRRSRLGQIAGSALQAGATIAASGGGGSGGGG